MINNKADLIQIRRDSLSNWESLNPKLADGEIGIVRDILKAKIGNGNNYWDTLPWFVQGLENYVVVKSLSDFPTPVSGVITLKGNVSYHINGNVDILNNRIELGVNTLIFGINRTTDILRASTLTGSMFHAAGKFTFMRDIQISCPNGSLFDLTGGVVQLLAVSLTTTANFGTMNNMSIVSLRNIASTQRIFTVGGLVLSGSCGNFSLVDALLIDNVGTFINFGTSTWDSVIIDRNNFTVNAGQTGFSGATGSANINTGGNGNVGGNNFTGLGIYHSGINHSDILWKFYDNGGMRNTLEHGGYNMVGNATITSIATVSAPVKIAGTTTASSVEKFTHTDNKLTYNGVDDITLATQFVASFYSDVNATKTWRFFIAKNGSVLSTSTQKISTTSNALLYVVISCEMVDYSTNDYVEAWVQNDTDDTDLTVDTLNFQIE